jgi:predicted transcriptional regulator
MTTTARGRPSRRVAIKTTANASAARAPDTSKNAAPARGGAKRIKLRGAADQGSFNFRVGVELKDSFIQWARANNRDGSLLLRDFMRAYVEHAKAQMQAKGTGPALSAVERKRRQAAVAYGMASAGLEGFSPSEEAQAFAERFINGEMSTEQFAQASYSDVHER